MIRAQDRERSMMERIAYMALSRDDQIALAVNSLAQATVGQQLISVDANDRSTSEPDAHAKVETAEREAARLPEAATGFRETGQSFDGPGKSNRHVDRRLTLGSNTSHRRAMSAKSGSGKKRD